MSKRNKGIKKTKANHEAYMARVSAEEQADRAERLEFTLQMFIDCADIELNRLFGFGCDRCTRFNEAMAARVNAWAAAVHAEAEQERKDEKNPTGSVSYTKSLYDRMLDPIFKDKFVPWEERYSR